jgi:preprotein translocase subunit SecD
MQGRSLWIIPIAIVVAVAVYIALPYGFVFLPPHPTVHQGLDLQGGLQAVLEADLPAGTTVTRSDIERAKTIVEQRVNGLGLSEAVVQITLDNRRIVVELPGAEDPQTALAGLRQTGLLEFVDMGVNPVGVDTVIQTDCINPALVDCGNPTGTLPLPTPVPAVTATEPLPGPFHTVMSGVAIADATIGTGQLGQLGVNFRLTNQGAQIFSAYTASHIGQVLAIVVDKQVISAPSIESAITQGEGTITGNFTQETANQLANNLRYGALPVPLKVIQSREVGPSLGADSVRQSIVAGVAGLTVVALFMLLYYRLPGAIAVVALLIYAVVTFALFKIIPVTLTLPGIAGFILSVGVAVDANILIFERMKEELRGGKSIHNAVDAGFSRAWPSIRDSNISTLITCGILFWFGTTFGASIVKGFAVTLALGVGVSLFTAILVTRVILHLFLDRVDFSTRHSWFGI